MSNPLQDLARFGVSPWFDNLSRKLVASGELERMTREDGLKGITSNPTIFQKAIDGSADYDAEMSALVSKGQTDPKRIFESLAVDDVRRAADILREVYNATGGLDGSVSLEVAPDLAFDTEGTIHEARRLYAMLNRPNVFIKVPATPQGVPAVARLLGEGIPVNVTLIFSIARYQDVMNAYLEGLERFEKTGRPLSEIRSVASFFVSRIDTAIDPMLKDASLAGKAAVANAKLAYEAYKKVFTSPRFETLRRKGARVQRPLWASTGTKNPAYRDVLYVEELIGPDTVNTMPDATWLAFRDHGKLRNSIEENIPEAKRTMELLAKAGVDLTAVTDKLEADGVAAFMKSYETLLTHIAAKAQSLQERTPEAARR
ncbi:MAG: transaldolase [Elusimicrobia bacterium]|nr:transaldolase [Elusimicrobiota bacterium]